MKPVVIYALIDPRDERVRYIGKTENSLARRLRGHFQNARQSHYSVPLNGWIAELLSIGMRPTIALIERVSPDDFWAERECYWIAQYRQREPDLFNLSRGGAGCSGVHFSEKRRETLRAATNARYSDPEERKKTGEKSKAYWSKERREEARQRMKAQFADPEKRARLINNRLLAQRKEEYRSKRSIMGIAQFADPATREKMAAKTRASFLMPGRREQQSAISTERFADPAFRAFCGQRVREGHASRKARAK